MPHTEDPGPVQMHLDAAKALERAAAEHQRRASQWECIGDNVRAVLERQLANSASVLAAGELEMARRASQSGEAGRGATPG